VFPLPHFLLVVDQLLQLHLYSQELFNIRFEYATKRFNRTVNNAVVIFDMEGVSMSLEMACITYMKSVRPYSHYLTQLLTSFLSFKDANHRPELLPRAFISPLYYQCSVVLHHFIYALHSSDRHSDSTEDTDCWQGLSSALERVYGPRSNPCRVLGSIHW
jgi:hypothetical protein